MLIELWPDKNSTGYILASEIVGVVDSADSNVKGTAVRRYIVLIKDGQNIRVNRENYEIAEAYLIERSDKEDGISKDA